MLPRRRIARRTPARCRGEFSDGTGRLRKTIRTGRNPEAAGKITGPVQYCIALSLADSLHAMRFSVGTSVRGFGGRPSLTQKQLKRPFPTILQESLHYSRTIPSLFGGGGRNRTDFAAISTKNSKFHQLIKRTLSLLGPAWTYKFGVRFGVRFKEGANRFTTILWRREKLRRFPCEVSCEGVRLPRIEIPWGATSAASPRSRRSGLVITQRRARRGRDSFRRRMSLVPLATANAKRCCAPRPIAG